MNDVTHIQLLYPLNLILTLLWQGHCHLQLNALACNDYISFLIEGFFPSFIGVLLNINCVYLRYILSVGVMQVMGYKLSVKDEQVQEI